MVSLLLLFISDMHWPYCAILSLQIPKAVLPLGNIPMVEFALRMLEREGFDDVIVVAQETVSKALVQLMDEQNDSVRSMQPMRIKLDITTIPNESDLGTADVLRLIREKIHVRALPHNLKQLRFNCDYNAFFSLSLLFSLLLLFPGICPPKVTTTTAIVLTIVLILVAGVTNA